MSSFSRSFDEQIEDLFDRVDRPCETTLITDPSARNTDTVSDMIPE